MEAYALYYTVYLYRQNHFLDISPGSGARRMVSLIRVLNTASTQGKVWHTDQSNVKEISYQINQAEKSPYDIVHIKSMLKAGLSVNIINNCTDINMRINDLYYMGNVAYYLNGAEWRHLLSSSRLLTYTMRPTSDQGTYGGCTWRKDAASGQTIYTMDDKTSWGHYNDWFARLRGVQSQIIAAVAVGSAPNQLIHELRYIYHKDEDLLEFDEYPNPPFGYITQAYTNPTVNTEQLDNLFSCKDSASAPDSRNSSQADDKGKEEDDAPTSAPTPIPPKTPAPATPPRQLTDDEVERINLDLAIANPVLTGSSSNPTALEDLATQIKIDEIIRDDSPPKQLLPGPISFVSRADQREPMGPIDAGQGPSSPQGVDPLDNVGSCNFLFSTLLQHYLLQLALWAAFYVSHANMGWQLFYTMMGHTLLSYTYSTNPLLNFLQTYVGPVNIPLPPLPTPSILPAAHDPKASIGDTLHSLLKCCAKPLIEYCFAILVVCQYPAIKSPIVALGCVKLVSQILFGAAWLDRKVQQICSFRNGVIFNYWDAITHWLAPDWHVFTRVSANVRSVYDWFANSDRDDDHMNNLHPNKKLVSSVINTMLKPANTDIRIQQVQNLARAGNTDSLTVSGIAQNLQPAIKEARRRIATLDQEPTFFTWRTYLVLFCLLFPINYLIFQYLISGADWMTKILDFQAKNLITKVYLRYGPALAYVLANAYYILGLEVENIISRMGLHGVVFNVIMDASVHGGFNPWSAALHVLVRYSPSPNVGSLAHLVFNAVAYHGTTQSVWYLGPWCGWSKTGPFVIGLFGVPLPAQWAPGILWGLTLLYQHGRKQIDGNPVDDLHAPNRSPGYGNRPVCFGVRPYTVRKGASVTPPYGKCTSHGLSYRVAGPRCRLATVWSYKPCTCNALGALTGRMAGVPKRYKDIPNHTSDDGDEISTHFTRVAGRMTPLLLQGVTPFIRRKLQNLTHDQWARRYTAQNAEKMRQAWLNGGESTTYSSFVKSEKNTMLEGEEADYTFESEWSLIDGVLECSAKDLPDPRGISVPAESVRYHLGPDADRYNKKLMRRFSGQVLYACGLSANHLSKWLEWVCTNHTWGIAVLGDDVLVIQNTPSGWQATSLDISRFDMHIRTCHLNHSYNLMRLLGLDQLATQLSAMGLKRSYKIRAPLQDGAAKIKATRASGDPDTISSNSIVTITIAWDAMLRGADLTQAFYDSGFVTTGTTHPLESPHWDFLQKLFYPCEIQGRPVRLPAPKIGRFAARAFWTRGATDHSTLAYARGVALGLEKDFQHVPIARSIIARILELSDGVAPEFDPVELRDREFKNFVKQPARITEATISFVCDRYHITPAAVAAIEQHILKWNWDSFLDDVESESWRSILKADLL